MNIQRTCIYTALTLYIRWKIKLNLIAFLIYPLIQRDWNNSNIKFGKLQSAYLCTVVHTVEVSIGEKRLGCRNEYNSLTLNLATNKCMEVSVRVFVSTELFVETVNTKFLMKQRNAKMIFQSYTNAVLPFHRVDTVRVCSTH